MDQIRVAGRCGARPLSQPAPPLPACWTYQEAMYNKASIVVNERGGGRQWVREEAAGGRRGGAGQDRAVE